MLRFKISPPPLPECVDRPRLLRGLAPFPVVVLAAPAGHGKTCLAAQLAAVTGGPTAWFVADELDRDRAGVVAQLLGALGAAWSDLGYSVPPDLDDDAALPQFGAALETLAGPGCLIIDDAHLLPVDVLDAVLRTAMSALPPDFRLVVCTRGGMPEPLVRAEALQRAISLGATDLVFDEDECARVCASVPGGHEVYSWTGGWPLAVALATRQDPAHLRPRALRARHISVLADITLAELPDAARELLVVLARLPRFPERLLPRLGDDYTSLASFGANHPELLRRDDQWWSPLEWMRDALRSRPADDRLVGSVARALSALDEHELAVQLLIAQARYEEAVPEIERMARVGVHQGRAAWVRALIASVPSAARTFELDLLAAGAAQALSIADPQERDAASEPAIRHLVERAGRHGPGAQLRAQALLAGHYRMAADPRLFAVCETALGDALATGDREQLVGRWPLEDTPAAAEMLRYYGHALLFSPDRATVERGRRLVLAAIELLEAIGEPTASKQAWLTYFEVLLFLNVGNDAVRKVRLAAHRLAELDHIEAPVRLAELATLEFFAGDYDAARRTIELARDCADRTGNHIALPPMAAIEVGIDVVDSAYEPAHGFQFDETLAQLEASRTLVHFTALIAAEFGIVLVQRGRSDVAGLYLERAEAALGMSYFSHVASLRCRRLRGLLLLAEGAVAEGRSCLTALRAEAVAEGRVGLIDLVDADLSAPWSDAPAARRAPSPITVHVLSPELSVTVLGEANPAPRGYPAKLLALLVASRGLMTVDAATEGLWPGADPEVGRNRLHGVLLRLRRGLGLPAGGPISCSEGLVRIDRSPALEVDSWEFEHLVASAESPDRRAEAVRAYRGDVLSEQFAYDDIVSEYRRELRRTYLRLTTGLLRDPPPALVGDEIAAVARRAWLTAPDDDLVCLVAAQALAHLGRGAEARELIEGTVAALTELGLDGEGFRRRAWSELGSAMAATPGRPGPG